MAVDLDLKLVGGATPTFAKVKKVVVSLVRGQVHTCTNMVIQIYLSLALKVIFSLNKYICHWHSGSTSKIV